MPAVSLVICLYGERDFLNRLLTHSAGCYDELLVVHDGPDTARVKELVEAHHGRFFEQPRKFGQEPHLPFAWKQAAHDWILRLDADEFPSVELTACLKEFRRAPEPAPGISGYTCIWPLWDGWRTVSKKWAGGRIFLFHRQRVRFFGMAEQVPIPDGSYEPLELTLHHQPARKSYGIANILLRKQAWRWRAEIARALLGQPGDLECWRWNRDAGWPAHWEQIRSHPLLTALRRLIREPILTLRNQWRVEGRLFPVAAFANPLHHAILCVQFWRLRRKFRVRAAADT